MDIFRAIVAKGEFSERVLSLTEDLLSLNPGSYTVWSALLQLSYLVFDFFKFINKHVGNIAVLV